MTTMALVARVARERRRILVPLAIAAVANLAVYALVVYPLSMRVAASERRAVAARAALQAAEQDGRQVQSTLGRAGQADTDLRRFYADTLPASLEGARRMSYARLAEVADEHGLVIERRSYDRDINYRGQLQRLRIGMTLSGEYRDIRAFIHDLEAGPEFLVIEDVSLTEGAQGSGVVVAVQLATYFAPPAGGA